MFTLYDVRCNKNSLQWGTVFDLKRTVYNVKRTVYDVRWKAYSVRCKAYCLRCTVKNVLCTMYGVRCTVYHVQCTMHGVPRTVKVNICKNGSVNFDKFINSPLIHNLMAVLKNTITLHVNALLFILLYWTVLFNVLKYEYISPGTIK